jgi:hypothetical protein
VFNGDGNNYYGSVFSATKNHVAVSVDSIERAETESPLMTCLALGVSKGDRFEWAIKKATELGVTSIVPILSQRVDVRLSPERWQKKQEHWQQIVISACEQSGRAVIPLVEEPTNLPHWLSHVEADCKLVLDPGAVGNDLTNQPRAHSTPYRARRWVGIVRTRLGLREWLHRHEVGPSCASNRNGTAGRTQRPWRSLGRYKRLNQNRPRIRIRGYTLLAGEISMALRIGVLMDPIATINTKKDTTLGMLRAASAAGHELTYLEQADLSIRNGETMASLRPLTVYDDDFLVLCPGSSVRRVVIDT